MSEGPWVLEYYDRPWTTNAERTWHYHKRAKKVKEWREAFCVLAIEQKIPLQDKIVVVATPILKSHPQDVGSALPAAKAAIDGIVDAGVIVDDTPDHLKAIMFKAPEKGRNALRIEIHKAP